MWAPALLGSLFGAPDLSALQAKLQSVLTLQQAALIVIMI
jgi:hypothetical protein